MGNIGSVVVPFQSVVANSFTANTGDIVVSNGKITIPNSSDYEFDTAKSVDRYLSIVAGHNDNFNLWDLDLSGGKLVWVQNATDPSGVANIFFPLDILPHNCSLTRLIVRRNLTSSTGAAPTWTANLYSTDSLGDFTLEQTVSDNYNNTRVNG
jgi:hypothetical protein